jgi:hypothetical protein
MRNKDMVLRRIELVKGKIQLLLSSQGGQLTKEEYHNLLRECYNLLEEAEGYVNQN